MTAHISAQRGDIAETVLMPGDPLRAKWIAETYLTDPVRYTSVRNMYGFTGTYKGHPVSIQGSGMGMPSASIYAHELLDEFGVKTLVRVGSAGAITKRLALRDVVAAIGASSESSMNRVRFAGLVDYAPVANFDLLRHAVDVGAEQDKKVHVGQVLSSDTFYSEDDALQKKLADYGVLAIEMEAAALYTLAAKFNARALALVTVSDHLISGEVTSSEERERSFADMIEIALETVIR
ncbi:MAG TPA: purine-nucleoside phosphorylase [Stackebrandtia sp.]|uniref:purine-nucleoside phosphorylase n=1 Tax=Stackebrandtia sp. TaxID=2023065 RepID=UPI002D53E28B|nr:purine-nucleoside phosphorylase [Stackebrandtia sp.]HZE41634.1 purine-nucleoside phosphorylase [Stackebrandtia sp.]